MIQTGNSFVDKGQNLDWNELWCIMGGTKKAEKQFAVCHELHFGLERAVWEKPLPCSKRMNGGYPEYVVRLKKRQLIALKRSTMRRNCGDRALEVFRCREIPYVSSEVYGEDYRRKVLDKTYRSGCRKWWILGSG